MSDLITVKQLPVIEARVREISLQLKEKTDKAQQLAVTPENKQEAKKLRAELNKDFAGLESARKAVKKAILEPYDKFEELYQKEIKTQYRDADNALRAKIGEIESAEREEKSEAVRDYVIELAEASPTPWGKEIILGRLANYPVGLSESITGAKKKVLAIAKQIESDCEAMVNMDNADEIYLSYKETGSLSEAISIVAERHKSIEQLKAEREAGVESIKKESEREKAIDDSLAPPVEMDNPETDEQLYTLSFTVRATKDKLVLLKKFLDDGGYEYDG